MMNNSKGVSLYLSMLVMSILLSLALGIGAILLGQIKTMKSMGNSVTAFYAANTGIERALYGISKGDSIGSHYAGFLGGSSYSADIIAPDGDCLAPYYCIKSTGVFSQTQTKRAIKIIR